MNATKLLLEFLQSGAQLWVEDDELCYRASQAALTPARREQLSERKAEIIALLGKQNTRYSSPSFAQQRLWILQQLEPGDTSYNMRQAIRVKGVLDVGALRKTLGAIAARQEALRTTFAVVDGSPVQVIAPAFDVPLPVEDLSSLPGAEREEAVQRRAHEAARKPFDLERGPLFRARLLRLGEEEHVLLISMHHVVSDGWSMGVLRGELATLYEAFSSGRPSPLAELPIQYADYALWQRQWLTGEVLEEQLSYWKGQLADVGALELPTDHPRPAVQTHRGARQKLVLPESLTEALKGLSRQEGTTLFMVLLGAFQALLARYSGQEDIAVGSPIAGRNQAETEGLIGFFVNTLVLRTDLSGDPTFKELLGRVREVALGAYAHQDLPFERLIEELQPERDLSRTPLFQVFLNMVNVPSSRIELPDLTIETILRPSELGEAEPKFDITLYAREREEGLELSAVYNADLFERDTISRMLGHFRTLLEGIAADPEQRLSSLSLLTATERRRRLPSWGARGGIRTTKPFTEWAEEEIEQSIPARFERQVRKHLHNVAIKTPHHEWSYAELNAKANRVARTMLARIGDGSTTRVALLFEHGAPMIAGLLGVLKAGKAYVPLDASHPEERLAYMLDDAQVGAVLTDEANLALATTLTEGELQLINVDEPGLADNLDSSVGAADVEDVDLLAVSPESVAYILYTSGSTGQPKGVVQNHRNVLHFIRAYTNNLRIGADDRLTLLSSYTHDAALMDIFGALLNGATLYPIDLKEEGFDALAERLVEWGVTIYHSTPTVYRHFVDTLNGSSEAEEKSPELRLVVLGGEAVNHKDVELYKAHFSEGCLFVNLLGASEASVALLHLVDRRTEIARHAVPAGHAIEDTEILLLDQAGREAEVYGEIAIRSPYVALGYWRKPELNQKVFLRDPAGGNRRIYRTGDVGRLLPDGAIEWRGRRDHQVKLRGYRIELGEVETVLGGCPGVRESAVVLREEEPGEPRLVAYVVPDERGQRPQTSELRGYLKERLPEYMMPSAFVVLDAMPLTSSRKVDRRALPAPDPSGFRAENAYAQPRTPVEEQLVEIWEDILGLERVGVHDDFFALGGHSLLAMRVTARLNRHFGVELPLRTLFEQPTIGGLALAVTQTQAEAEIDIEEMLAQVEQLQGRSVPQESYEGWQ
jgi:amino acid adenylation domain-containing protein